MKNQEVFARSLPALAAVVREGSQVLFLLALLLPRQYRGAAMALFGFYLETAGIPAKAREPLLAHIRLQWWREALEGGSGMHPVLDGLRTAGIVPEGLLGILAVLDTAISTGITDDAVFAEGVLGTVYALLARIMGAEVAESVYFRRLGAGLQLYPALRAVDTSRASAARSYLSALAQEGQKSKFPGPLRTLAKGRWIIQAALQGRLLSHHQVPAGIMMRLLISF